MEAVLNTATPYQHLYLRDPLHILHHACQQVSKVVETTGGLAHNRSPNKP